MNLTRTRATVQRTLMPDTCAILTPGTATRTSTGGVTPGADTSSTVACGVIDPRRSPAQPESRGEAQLQIRGELIFRLPWSTATLALGQRITYGGRTYAVVDPGPPAHGLALARYVGVEEVAHVSAPSTASDSFGRPDAPTLGAWALARGSFGLVDGAAYSTFDGEAAAYWTAQSFSADQYAQARIASIVTGSSEQIGVAVRCSLNNYYGWYTRNSAGGTQLFKVVDGTWLALWSGTLTLAPGAVLRLEAVGSTLRGYIDGALIVAVVDTTVADGAPGIAGYKTSINARVTDWSGGPL